MNKLFTNLFVPLFCGVLFGFGLCFSDMINPGRVLAFLDLTGNWDPTLLFVMIGALVVTIPGYHIAVSKKAPLFDTRFHFPTSQKLDSSLITGAVMFGIGWGLIGMCPGPAISGLALGIKEIWVFVIAMFVGFYLLNFFKKII